MRARALFSLTFAVTLAGDLLTKAWVLDHFGGLKPGDPGLLAAGREVTGFFNLVLVYNYGVSFGFMGGGSSTWQPFLLAGVAAAVALGLAIWAWRAQDRLLALAFGLIVGGALGNAIDRLRHGAVVDFLDFHVGDWHWPAFNLADSAITLGVAVVLIDGLFLGKRRSK